MLALQGTGGGLDPIGCRRLVESLGGQSQVGGAVHLLCVRAEDRRRLVCCLS